jgi:hypothetical protein
MTLSNSVQTLEEAQDTNRRMNRRLGAVEAELHRLCSKAMDQVQDANELLRASQQLTSTRERTITYLQERQAAYEDQLQGRFVGGWALFIWAMTATIMAFMLYAKLP